MNILGSIFFIAITITLIFAGAAKMISYSNTIYTIKKVGIFPEKISKAIGIFMPIFEIIIAVFLMVNPNKLTIVSTLGYLLFFIALNLKYAIEDKEIRCCCYGKFIESKLGIGGFIHYLYLLVLLIGGYACINNSIIDILNQNGIYDYMIFIIVTVSICIMVNGFLIRSIVEKYRVRKW
ncbi:MauE/DoxX family redox-associated membrane protein [Clostridium beijerinckii]|uniref:Methylamine utilisation protein MauE domain-containing protein n=1 Tax=Clostridium beijerinckii TaxID=1520 RepID=A0A7X9XSB8_CLOBE|nr:MauE/DoxX family redox-associated membrane protein [Clostridium beijerinckii]NMF07936.1 hypothetical protein [Clostridium beijerinckii]